MNAAPDLVAVVLDHRPDEETIAARVAWTCRAPACGKTHQRPLFTLCDKVASTEIGRAALLVFVGELARAWTVEVLCAAPAAPAAPASTPLH